MQVSPLQQAILDQVQNTNDNISISGVAGCGKSTTLQLIAAKILEIQTSAKILYLAFNNEICSDIAPKLEPLGVSVLTFHKWGNRAITWKKRINGYKYTNYVQEYFDAAQQVNERSPFGTLTSRQIIQVIDIIRLWYIPVDATSVARAFEHWDIDLDDEWMATYFENFVAFLKEVVTRGMNEKNTIDFVDMLVFPIRHRLLLERFTHILVDESQDLSPIMQKMISVAMQQGARIINVGDRQQAINGFAGALPDSFDKLRELTQAVEMPLSICYRCPDAVIDLAKKYVPEIEGTGKDGQVNHVDVNQMFETLQTKDLIICRKNAPLVSLAFRLMANGFKVVIKGRKFADYILYYVRKVQKTQTDFDRFVPTLDDIISKIAAKTKSEDRIEMLHDVQECLETLIEESDVEDFKTLINLVNRLFNENTYDNSVVLCSFHRSKGLQNETVWVLMDKGKLTEPGCQQESNLAYVAITRTLHTLNLVNFNKTAKKTLKN